MLNQNDESDSEISSQDSDVFQNVPSDTDPEEIATDKFAPLDKESRKVLRVSKYDFCSI